MSDMTLGQLEAPSPGLLDSIPGRSRPCRRSTSRMLVGGRSLPLLKQPAISAASLASQSMPSATVRMLPQPIEHATADRRMSRARTTVQLGGIAAAIAFYREAPTPNLIVVESRSAEAEFVAELDRLAEVCDAGTKVMAVGHTNDIAFYREIMRRGISEYILAPVQPSAVIAAIS